MGGNWDYKQLGDHYDMYHNLYLCNDVTYEEWKEAEERHRVSPYIFTDTEDAISDDEKKPTNKGNSTEFSNGKSSSSRKVKSSRSLSGNSSDSSNSGNSSEQK